MPPALAGGFLTTAPPGKSWVCLLPRPGTLQGHSLALIPLCGLRVKVLEAHWPFTLAESLLGLVLSDHYQPQ